ncbi:MAG: thrombospondin type 3 repeat-containing protein, partial [Verrucomicrobiota bacterium]
MAGLSALPASGQITEVARVTDAAGQFSSSSNFVNISAVGQPYTTGLVKEPGEFLLHSGYLNSYLVYTNDLDGDGLADENDLDDDGDGLLDINELSGSNICPYTASNPLDADTDNDGADDGQEISVGTNPRDPGMRLAIVATSYSNGMFHLTWTGRSQLEYTVMRSPTLSNLIQNATDVNMSPIIPLSGMGPYSQFFSTMSIPSSNPKEF